jgi:hypothetical protein
VFIVKDLETPDFGSVHSKEVADAFFTSVHSKGGAFNRSKQHHLIDVLFKDGVYERRKTIETVSLAEN